MFADGSSLKIRRNPARDIPIEIGLRNGIFCKEISDTLCTFKRVQNAFFAEIAVRIRMRARHIGSD